METAIQTQTLPRTPSSKLSPLKQHPILSESPLSSPDATRTIFLDHPTARWSSSPASSPRIVEPSPVRGGSVYPALSDTMQRGVDPGIDFFDDASSGSDWEDSEGDMTQTFADGNGLGLRSLIPEIATQTDNTPRGRSRKRSGGMMLPIFKQPPASHSGLDLGAGGKSMSSPVDPDGSRRARHVSLKRLSKENVRVIHTSRGPTPRNSLRSSSSKHSASPTDVSKSAPKAGGALPVPPKEDVIQGRHRRNTSDSILAGSIIDAHVMTMRALESLNASPSSILVDPHSRLFTRPSFTDNRHVKLPPLSTKDRDRPANLPAHFVQTPYPFSAKKVFPKPKNRPRSHSLTNMPYSAGMDGFMRLDSGYGENSGNKEYDDTKGKHVLGLITSDGEYDLRSRLERNADAQGVSPSRMGSGIAGSESVVWMSLQRRTGRNVRRASRMVKVTVPSSLTTDGEAKKGFGSGETVDFDDTFFAERMRKAHGEVAGNWVKRAVSARTLSRISLGQVSTWSGTASQLHGHAPSGLLAVGAGLNVESDSRSPFTEDSLIKLYRNPASGKARYTWVHWARRVAASNTSRPPHNEKDSHSVPDSLTTIQFVHTLSIPRVLAAIALMLVLSVLAALLWIFVGPAGMTSWVAVERQRSARVGSGMAVGVLVLLVEGVGLGAWVWFS